MILRLKYVLVGINTAHADNTCNLMLVHVQGRPSWHAACLPGTNTADPKGSVPAIPGNGPNGSHLAKSGHS
jgi:hypothetical protein